MLFRFLLLSLVLRAFQEVCMYSAIRYMLSWQDVHGAGTPQPIVLVLTASWESRRRRLTSFECRPWAMHEFAKGGHAQRARLHRPTVSLRQRLPRSVCLMYVSPCVCVYVYVSPCVFAC